MVCDVLGFNLIEDTPLADGKRWVLVRRKEPQGHVCYRQCPPKGALCGGALEATHPINPSAIAFST